jgi:RhtB (resistance to homoserine/threonine) family protein
MILLAQLLIFILPVTLLTITPGVDTLLVIRNTHRGGWRDGAASSLGVCTGLFVHALVSALGISLILLQSALAFNLLKFAGAGYLVWLGVTSLRAALISRKTYNQRMGKSRSANFQLRRSFLEGLLSNVLNPKTIVFYMAFLPQFIDPAGSALQQSLLLAALHFVIAMGYQCLLAALIEKAGRWMNNHRLRRCLDGATGLVMLLFGIKLALESR